MDKLLSIANAGLQTVATLLVLSGGYLIYDRGELTNGAVLIGAGLLAYIVYEILPSK